jgi:hypothetical protein
MHIAYVLLIKGKDLGKIEFFSETHKIFCQIIQHIWAAIDVFISIKSMRIAKIYKPKLNYNYSIKLHGHFFQKIERHRVKAIFHFIFHEILKTLFPPKTEESHLTENWNKFC